MSEISRNKCEPQDIILNKYIKREPIDEPIEFDYDNDHDIPPTNQCSTKDSEFSTDKVKDEIKLEDDEMDGVRYESICKAENDVVSPMTSSMTNGILSHSKKNSTNAPEINHNTDTPLKPCSTKDSEFSTDKVKDEIKLEDDEMDGVRYESICKAENDVVSPMTSSMTNGILSHSKKNSTNAPEINHNTDTPLKSCSTKDSEFSKDKVKDEIKLEDDEMDGITYKSIYEAENDVVSPMSIIVVLSHSKKNSTNAPEINHNTDTPLKSCSTKDSEFSKDKVKDEIKLEDDEMDGITYKSIYEAENDVVSPMTSSMTNGILSHSKKNSTNAPEINHNTDTPLKSCSTKDSEFSKDKVKDEIKLEDDEMDGITYKSICEAENDVVSPMTSSMTNGILSHSKKNSTNAPEINHNTDTPLKSCSTKDSEFSKDKVKDEIKLEDDEMDGITYKSICEAENDVVSPMTSSMTNGILSHSKKNSTNAPEINHNTDTPLKSCSTKDSEFSKDKVKDEIKLEDDEMDGITYKSICEAENDVVSPMTSSMTNGILSHSKKNSTNAPEINHNTDTPLKSCSTKDSEFSTDKVKDEIKLEDDEMDGITYKSIYEAENDVVSPMTNGILSHSKKNSSNAPEINHNTETPLKSCSTKDSEFSTDKVKDEIKLEDDEMDGITYKSICEAENYVVSPMTSSMTNGILSHSKKNSTNAPEINHYTDTLLKSSSTKDSEFSTDKVKDEIKLEDDEMDGVRYESICEAEHDVLSPMTTSMTNGILSHSKKNTTNAPEINHYTDTPLKSSSTKDSEFSKDKVKDEIKLEDDEMDGITYNSIYEAENDVVSPMTSSMTNGILSHSKKNSTNAPEINHNTDTPLKSCSTKDSEFSKDKVKDEIKLEDDEMDGITYKSICEAENDVVSPMTSSMTNGILSHSKKNSTNAPEINHNTDTPLKSCSTKESEFSKDKVKDEIKLEDDEMDGITYKSICEAENYVVSPMTSSMTNGILSHSKKNSTNAPEINHNTYTPLKSCSTKDSEFSKDKVKDEIKLEDDEMDGITYKSICEAENYVVSPMTSSMTNGILSHSKKNSTNAPEINHNTYTPLKSCSTKDSEFSKDKVKDEIKLEDDEMDGITYNSIYEAENDVVSPMTSSMTNGILSHSKKNSTNAPEINHNTDTPLKSCSTKDSEFSKDKVKDEIKLEDDEMDGITYKSICEAENYVVSPMTSSMTNGILSHSKKNSTNAPEINHNTYTPLKSCSTKDSEFSKDKVKDEIKLEDDEMDGITYNSIYEAENDVVSPMTSSMTNGILSHSKKNSTNAPEINHNTDTPLKSCSTKDSEFSKDKVKDEIKLEDDEMDGITYKSICEAENDVVSPMTSSMTNGILSHSKKNSTNAPEINHNTDTPLKSCSTKESEFSKDKVKDEIKLEDDEMDGITYKSICEAENYVVSPMTSSMTNGILSHSKKNSTNAPEINHNTYTPLKSCSTKDSEFSKDKVKDEIKLEDDEMDGITYKSICEAENDVVSPMTSSMTNGILSHSKKNSSNAPEINHNTETPLKSCSTKDSEFSKDKVKDEIKLEDDEMDGITYKSICEAENYVVSPMTSSMTNGILSHSKKNSTNAPEINHNTYTPLKSCSTKDSEFSKDKVKDEIKLEDDEMDGITYNSIYEAENDVVSPMTSSMTNGILSHSKKNSTNAPEINHNTDTPLKSCSTKDSEFSKDKVKDEIKLEDDEMDGITYKSICEAENYVVSPMTSSMTNGILSHSKKNSTNAPEINHNTYTPLKSCSTKDSEFSKDKVKDEIKLEDDEMDGITYNSIYEAENDVVSPMTSSMTNGILSHSKKNSTNAPEINHNTDTPLKSCSTKDSEFSKDKVKDEIKLEDDEMDGITYKSICEAENDVVSPMTSSMTNGILSHSKKNSTNAPEINHNTDTPLKSCSTKESEFSKDKVKDEIKLEDDEMDGITYKSICEAENYVVSPMTSSMTNGILSHSKKNSTNAPEINHNTYTPLKSCSTKDSEFSKDKVKDEIKLEDDEMDGITYKSICEAENDVVSPMTSSMTNGILSHSKKNSSNAPEINHNTETPLKSCSTKDSEFSKDKVKDEIKLEDDEMDGITYKSICEAENYVVSPMTSSMTNGILSHSKKNSTNAPEINHNTYTPLKSCSTKDSEFSKDKVKDEIKLEDDEMDGITYKSICEAENDVVSPMTSSMTNGILSHSKKNSSNAPEINHNTETPLKSCSTKDSEFSTDKVKDEIKLEDDEMDGVRYESICEAENDVLSPMTTSMTNGILSHSKKNSTNAPEINHNTDTPLKSCSKKDSEFEFSIDKVKDEIKLEDDEMEGIRYEIICKAENDVLLPMTPSMKNSTKLNNKKNTTMDPKIIHNTNTSFKSRSTKDSEFGFSIDKLKDEIKLEDDEMDGITYESICEAENDVLLPMTTSMTNVILSHSKKNSTNAPEIYHNNDTPLKSCSTKDSEISTDIVKDEIKLGDVEMDGIRYEIICEAENDVVSPMTSSMTNGILSHSKKNSTNAPEINHNNDTPLKSCSTKDSEISTDIVKDEIKLGDVEMDGIRYEIICEAENNVLLPMTPSMKNSTKLNNKKNTTKDPKIIHNTNTSFKSRSTKDSELSTDKGKVEIKLEVDEIDGIRYESICVTDNDVLSPMTPSMKNSTKPHNKKDSTNVSKIVHNTNTPFKSRFTKDSEVSMDEGKDETKLEVDEIDGIRYESICVAENYVLPPMTPTMKNSKKSHNKKNSTNAPEINHNSDTPFQSRSTKDSEFSSDKCKNESKLEVDEIDGIRYESICVAENVVLSPMTPCLKNSTKSHNKKTSIKAPKIVYNTDRPYICDTCKKTFTRKEHLKTHKLIHTGKKPFKCETCDKSFTRKDNFKSHQMIHTGEKPFKCGVCNKSFLHKGHIRSHIRIHTGERPYKCNACGKLFLQEGHLKTHKKTHSSEKPYKCNRCDKSYSRKDNLESHQKIHLGEKPFKCDICKKDFLQKGHVRIHIRTHTGEKPFKCVYCNKKFSRKDNMKDHIGRLHTK